MVRATWWRDDFEPDDSDPFENVAEEPVVAPECPADPPDAMLERELRETLQREAELDALGVSCPIKRMPDSTCHACPVRRTDDRDPLKPLCDVGLRQEQILSLLAARKHG